MRWPLFWLAASLVWGAPAAPAFAGTYCGNGVVEAPEECDDGNIDPGDGCDEMCRVEQDGGNVPTGSVAYSYDCEGASDGGSAVGGAQGDGGILYDFPDGPGGNFAQVDLGYSMVYSATTTLDNRAVIALPGSATIANCLIGGSVSLTQPFTFTTTLPQPLPDTVTVAFDVILDGWQAHVPSASPAGSDTRFGFDVSLAGTGSFTDTLTLDAAGLQIANQPGAFTVDPLPGGGVSVSGALTFTRTLPTSSPAFVELFAEQAAFVPVATQGFTITNTLAGAFRSRVRSLTPGIEVRTLGLEPPVEPPAEEPQTKPQQKCLTGLNKAAAKVVSAQTKLNEKCVKAATQGKESSAQGCVQVDPKQKVQKASEKALNTDGKKCQRSPDQLPTFSYVPASLTSAAAADEGRAYLADLLGADADLAIPMGNAEAGCQQGVLKSADKYLNGLLKEAVKAKKNALKGGAASPSQLGAAMESSFGASKPTKLEGKLSTTAAKKCAEVADLGQLFPGMAAAGTTPQSVAEDASRAARCRACLLLNTFDELSLGCDALDDGAGNASCP